MKIVVVSHTYIVDLNTEKLRILAELEPDLQVTIVVPKQWRPGGVMADIVRPSLRQVGSLKVVPLPNWSQENQGLLCFGWEYVRLLRSLRPDVILVEQGAKSLAYAQSILINQLWRLKSKLCLFTWWNLPYTLKFPVSLLEEYNLRYTDGLICGNQDGIDILEAHGYRGPSVVMPQLGIDERIFCPQPQPKLKADLGIDPQDFVVGFVGRFVIEKGILTLVKALAHLRSPAWKVLLLGRGELEREIRQQAETAGISDRLILMNSVPHDQVPSYINLMDTLVLPSETLDQRTTLTSRGWKEQFGHVIIEAMGCKVPVIGSDSGEIPNVIQDAGLIFPEGNVEQLADCLNHLMEDAAFRKNLGEKGYHRAMENYTNRALAQRLLDFFKDLFRD